jgi:nucleoside-diphosphate-sugar epimerase
MIRIPSKAAVAAAHALQRLGLGISAEQVQRLQEDKVFDCSAAQRDLCYTARAFEVGLAQELEWLRRPPSVPS